LKTRPSAATIQLAADLFALYINLDAPAARAEGRVLQRAKAGLAHHALEHHAPGHLGGGVECGEFLGCFGVVLGKQACCVVGRFEVVGEGDAFALPLLLADGFEFFSALQDQLVFVGSSR
jgi:hypothetical protein